MPETGVMGTITLFCETKGMNRMDMSTVALVPVSSSDQAEVDAAVRTGVELLGFAGVLAIVAVPVAGLAVLALKRKKRRS